MRLNSFVIRAIASSQVAMRNSPFSRISGVVRRSRERVNWWAKRPLTQVWPLFAGPSSAGLIDAILPSRTCVSSRQPTPQ